MEILVLLDKAMQDPKTTKYHKNKVATFPSISGRIRLQQYSYRKASEIFGRNISLEELTRVRSLFDPVCSLAGSLVGRGFGSQEIGHHDLLSEADHLQRGLCL